ncbi:MAG: hypothetical protein KJO40_19880 [Deltaproteobacteria bacterium]|nr:hypothetical protein [Deltaproteobacteria bacterium]NND28792.1 hypothetical protein [Myxococcales bacterium]MBT8466757.1 hypothetical protein [Deltaproteobacteria bacterium]MBT8483768.1 hypothetical protein [Deltaproteobacteria bacterium]NNK07348.1 hypothetical protein [Myxococcales bacterium]
MTRNDQLRRSSTRLQKQGMLWLQHTRGAGEAFLAESREAGLTFVKDMEAAGSKLVSTTGRSTQSFRKALEKEALDWQRLVLQTKDAYLAALKARFDRVERQALTTREALRPESMEMTVLGSAKDLLDKAQSRVDERLELAAKPAAQDKAPKGPRAAKARPAKASAKSADAPLRNYDQLTAKDVVNRVQRLSGPKATAVLEYERARKRRATVIRAAEQRMSAAS